MATQGGSHEQHVKAGQQSHKNSDTKQASSKKPAVPSKDGSSKAQHSSADGKSHKRGN